MVPQHPWISRLANSTRDATGRRRRHRTRGRAGSPRCPGRRRGTHRRFRPLGAGDARRSLVLRTSEFHRLFEEFKSGFSPFISWYNPRKIAFRLCHCSISCLGLTPRPVGPANRSPRSGAPSGQVGTLDFFAASGGYFRRRTLASSDSALETHPSSLSRFALLVSDLRSRPRMSANSQRGVGHLSFSPPFISPRHCTAGA